MGWLIAAVVLSRKGKKRGRFFVIKNRKLKGLLIGSRLSFVVSRFSHAQR